MMTKEMIKGMAAGILFASISIGIYFYVFQEKPSEKLSFSDIEQAASSEGYVLMKEEDAEKEKEEPQKTATKLPETKESGMGAYTLVVKAGMTPEDIGDLLAQNGIIEDSSVFSKYMADRNRTTQIQVGEYIVTKEMSLKQIVNTVTK